MSDRERQRPITEQAAELMRSGCPEDAAFYWAAILVEATDRFYASERGRAHQTADFDLHPAEGWYSAQCTCGFTEGPFPDPETMVDALMEHAYLAAYEDMKGMTQRMVTPDG